MRWSGPRVRDELILGTKKTARRLRAKFMPDRQPPIPGLSLTVERFMYFRGRLYVSGWVQHAEFDVTRLAYRLPGGRTSPVKGWPAESSDRSGAAAGATARSRFEFEVTEPDPYRAAELRLVVSLSPGYVVTETLLGRSLQQDPYHRLLAEYFDSLRAGGVSRVLEIGARNRSGNVRRDLVGPDTRYTGLDVVAGENVDVVGDAHDMSGLFEPETFDSVFSISTFEHLAMPWKVALEINRVLVDGGTVLTATHQTWPLHEQPWDFWRFSDSTWATIFNRYTGFEIEQVAMGEPASIVPNNLLRHNVMHPLHPAMMASAVVCRKIGQPKVSWDIPLDGIIDSVYPN